MKQWNEIYCGNCAEIMKQIDDGSIDLTVTSPPYDKLREYNGYTFEFEPIARELWRVTKPGGVVVWITNDETINGGETLNSFRQAIRFQEIGFIVHDTMIYKKKSFSFPESTRYYPVFEYCFVFSVGPPVTVNLISDRRSKNIDQVRKSRMERQPNGNIRRPNRRFEYKKFGVRHNVWEYDNGSMITTKDKKAFAHPAIFPEALARDHIISWSNPGDLVLDPMCGSGTTLKMAKELGRDFIGIDISQEYCDLSRRRVEGARVPLPGLLTPPQPSQPNWEQMEI